MSFKVLVFGGSGQLGESFKELNLKDCFYPTREELSVTSPEEKIESFIRVNKINVVLNLSAYTNVDGAETNTEEAMSVNGHAFLGLSRICNRMRAKLIHVSTDYVFDGEKNAPYTEEDEKNPKTAYGRSKSLGEDLIMKNAKDYVIVRTSWLYSKYRKNFLLTIHQKLLKNENLKIVHDQRGTPTSCYELALILKKLIEENVSNEIYHFSGEGECSWYDFACEIRKYTSSSSEILPIESTEFPSKVDRPKYSVLSKAKIKEDLNVEVLHWKDALKNFFEN